MAFCKQCGARITINTSFCPVCGAQFGSLSLGQPPLQPAYPPAATATPKTIKTVMALGTVFGVMAVILGLAGITQLIIYMFSGHSFIDNTLTVSLEADSQYAIEEMYASTIDRCQVVSGPEGARWDLQMRSRSYKFNSASWYTTHTFTTDTTGEYIFVVADPKPDARYRLVQLNRPTAWMIFGLPLAFFVFGPATLVFLNVSRRMKANARRFQAMTETGSRQT